MKRNGKIHNASIGLTLNWEIDLRGITAELGELSNNTSLLVGFTQFAARATMSAVLAHPTPVTVRGAMINVLVNDRKELYYLPPKTSAASRILIKLTKQGPLWDPSDDARQGGHFPYSTVPTNIPVDGDPHLLMEFVDLPHIEAPKVLNDQELLFINGLTTFLIFLVAMIKEGTEDEEPVILFRAKWIIDWRFRPAVRGWNSQGEPMGFEVEGEGVDDIIDQLHALQTANGVTATEIGTTWT
jgi:hypothetical protein